MMNHDMYSSQIENRSYVTEQQTGQKSPTLHSSVYKFRDIENVIQLAHRLPQPFFNSKLFQYHSYYYLVVYFPESRLVRGKDWVESLILEYGERCHVTTHRLEEYGRELITENALATIKAYFKALV
ncbi:adaptor protein MecA [Caldalkalibacillus salinus]|uniref:adaptor protein MecA n=1 Tax=Caldalkalibacillus salinus TaxID=2803787 RepID=UPI0019249F31|nr:adaptor protein MecA [Caldalkalibacillus salinus]